MARFRNKTFLAAVAGETQEEHPSNDQSRNMFNPRIDVIDLTKVCEQIDGRVTVRVGFCPEMGGRKLHFRSKIV